MTEQKPYARRQAVALAVAAALLALQARRPRIRGITIGLRRASMSPIRMRSSRTRTTRMKPSSERFLWCLEIMLIRQPALR